MKELEFEPTGFGYIEENGDAKLCKLGDICKNSLICNLMNCEDFISKVRGKGSKEEDKNFDHLQGNR